MIRLLTNLESFPATVLAQVTMLLLAAIVIHQTAPRSPAARHAVLFWALIAAGFCPLLNCAVRSLGFAPLTTASSVPPPNSPSYSENVVESLVSGIHSESPARFPLADMLPVLWLAGTLLALVRLGRGWHVTHTIRRASRPIAGELPEPVLNRLSMHLGRAPPEILISDRIRVPMAVGCFRSVILLPSTLRPMLDDRQLLQVLIHECAHAVRRDPLVGLYQRILAAAFWFHPLVHLANRLLDRAREELCDNHVLRSVAPTEYSRTLLTIAESISLVPNGLLTQTLFQSARHLDHRVAGLLNPRRCTMI
ncbi:MAG TPA: M56 family metallopeptidase, partial [Pirellulales bacterium]|nr:M56 family metallopeptidase [Pirellulales bacterium]